MTFFKSTYYGEEAKKKKRKIINRLKHHKFAPNIYVLAIPEYDNNLIDIYKPNTLLWPHYKDVDIKVIGVAKGDGEAYELAKTIIWDVYSKTQGFDIKSYFKI